MKEKRGDRRRWWGLLGLVPVVLILYLLWGPLFPFHPIWPGYQSLELSGATVRARDVDALSPAYEKIPELMQHNEESLGLEYLDPVTVMALQSDRELERFAPWMSGRPGAFAYQSGGVMFITAKKQGVVNLDEYLCHELNHLLLYQNAGPGNAMTMHRQRWLAEGVAVHFCGPYYMQRGEFLDDMQDVQLEPRTDEKNILADVAGMSPRVSYTAYRFMVQHIIDTYGEDRFRELMGRYVEEPQNLDRLVAEILGHDLSHIVRAFAEEIQKEKDTSGPAQSASVSNLKM